jgi:hypothetical protein
MTTTKHDKGTLGDVAIGGSPRIRRPAATVTVLQFITIGKIELNSGLEEGMERRTGLLKWLVCLEELGNSTRLVSPLTRSEAQNPFNSIQVNAS